MRPTSASPLLAVQSARLTAAGAVTLTAVLAGLGAQTNVGGPIVSNTTWTLAGSPYVVTQSILIGGGATLTIDAGVEVRLGNNLGITVGLAGFGAGAIVARGNAANRIRFTTSTPPNGRWSSVRLLDLAADGTLNLSGNYSSGCIFEHCVFDSASPGNPAAGVLEGIQSSPLIWNCEVVSSGSYGIYLDGSAGTTPTPGARLQRCTARGASYSGIYVYNGGPHVVTDNYAENCGTQGGSAIYAYSTQGTITFERNVVRGGGGVSVSPRAPSRVTNNVLAGCAGLTVSGPTGGTTDVQDNEIRSCTGPALSLSGYINATRNHVTYNRSTGANLSANVVFRDNEVVGNQGVGVSASGNCTVERNVIAFNGRGGLSAAGGVIVNDNLINDNTGTYGGGVYLSGAPASFSRNTIARNRATNGGGIYVGNGVTSIAGNAGVDFNRLVGNDAVQGADIYFAAPFPAQLDARYNCYAGPGSITDANRVWDFFDNSSLGIVDVTATTRCDPIADLGLGLGPAGGSPPRLAATGSMITATPLTWNLTNARPNSPSVFIIAPTASYLPFGGIIIPDLGALSLSLPFVTDNAGTWTLTIPAPNANPGVSLYTQAFVNEPSLPFPFAFSNGIIAVKP